MQMNHRRRQGQGRDHESHSQHTAIRTAPSIHVELHAIHTVLSIRLVTGVQ